MKERPQCGPGLVPGHAAGEPGSTAPGACRPSCTGLHGAGVLPLATFPSLGPTLQPASAPPAPAGGPFPGDAPSPGVPPDLLPTFHQLRSQDNKGPAAC